MKIVDNLLERAEAAETLEVRESHGHLWLVVVVLVQVGSSGVQTFCKLLVGVSLSREWQQSSVAQFSTGLKGFRERNWTGHRSRGEKGSSLISRVTPSQVFKRYYNTKIDGTADTCDTLASLSAISDVARSAGRKR